MSGLLESKNSFTLTVDRLSADRWFKSTPRPVNMQEETGLVKLLKPLKEEAKFQVYGSPDSLSVGKV